MNGWTEYLTCVGFCMGGTLVSTWGSLDIWWTLSPALVLVLRWPPVTYTVKCIAHRYEFAKQHFSGEHRVMNGEPKFKKQIRETETEKFSTQKSWRKFSPACLQGPRGKSRKNAELPEPGHKPLFDCVGRMIWSSQANTGLIILNRKSGSFSKFH